MDRMSGSGVFARDADTIVTLTEHSVEGCYTLEMCLRNLPPQLPFVVEWTFPVMVERPDLDPDDLKKDEKTEDESEFLLELLDEKPLTTTEWQKRAQEEGVARATFYRAKSRLEQTHKITTNSNEKTWSRAGESVSQSHLILVRLETDWRRQGNVACLCFVHRDRPKPVEIQRDSNYTMQPQLKNILEQNAPEAFQHTSCRETTSQVTPYKPSAVEQNPIHLDSRAAAQSSTITNPPENRPLTGEEIFQREEHERHELEEAIRRIVNQPPCKVRSKLLEKLAQAIAGRGSSDRWWYIEDFKRICPEEQMRQGPNRGYYNANYRRKINKPFPPGVECITVGKFMIIRDVSNNPERPRFGFIHTDDLKLRHQR